MDKQYRQGFSSLSDECDKVELKGSQAGKLPDWLNGIYIKNGPAQFRVGEDQLEHWFDGFAMLTKIEFKTGKIYYTNRFLKSKTYVKSIRKNKLCFRTFASFPKFNIIRRFIEWFRNPSTGDNANVNIVRIGDRDFTLTESPNVVEFDINSLETLDTIVVKDEPTGQMTTAHPLYDFQSNELINLTIKLGRESEYCYYKTKGNVEQREQIACIATAKPSYTHSFAITDKYIVHVENPLVVNPLRLRFGNIPYIKCYQWDLGRDSTISLVERSTGTVFKAYTVKPFFAFHYINAFEEDGNIYLDVAATNDASSIDDLYLQNLRSTNDRPISQPAELRRYRLSLQGDETSFEVLSPYSLEMPVINRKQAGCKRHRYVYAVGYNENILNDFENQLVKIDCDSGEAIIWFEENCYPTEPCFISAPDGNEDEGVILSIVLDGDKALSFLVVLNAVTFIELGRYYLPHIIPFGFHGMFHSA